MLKRILSENPEKALWWHLSHFKNVDRIAPLIVSNHNNLENAKKQAKQIRYCIEQAEEYFLSAQHVTIATRPLLLYYGMASLAWALVLFKKTGDYSLDKLQKRHEHQDHGLKRPNVSYGIRTQPLTEILERVRAEVPRLIQSRPSGAELPGTFGLLYGCVQMERAWIELQIKRGPVTTTDRTPLESTSSLPNPATISGSFLSLGRLLLQIPDMVPPFAELGIRPPFAFCSQAKIGRREEDSEQTLVMTFSRMREEEVAALRARFPPRAGLTCHEFPAGLGIEVRHNQGERVVVPALRETIDGRHYVFIPEEPELLPETCALLAAMFLLGMLVRYYPHIWMELLDRRHVFVEVLEAFLPIAVRKYPNLILNNLSGDSFGFAYP